MNVTAQATQCHCDHQSDDAALFSQLDIVLSDYKDKKGSLIPVLQYAQAIFGYLPEGAIKRISEQLGKSYSEVYGVIGFYSFFSTVPRGKHLIRVCLGTACYVRGGKQVIDSLKKSLKIDVGGTTEDRLFSLSIVRCIGACGLAPAIMVDNVVHQRVKPSKVDQLLAQYSAEN